jgi:transposase
MALTAVLLFHLIIVPKWLHLMKHLNEQISKIRRKIQKNSEDEGVKTVLKGSRWLLVRNRTNLSSKVNPQADYIA